MYNEILEEEYEIIEVFNRELEIFGHKGYCSLSRVCRRKLGVSEPCVSRGSAL